MENNQTNNVIGNKLETCYEDISARTECSKKFTNPKSGLHTAVLFSSPVHSSDCAEMAAVNNDFIDTVNEEGEEVYENRRNKFLVRLAKSTAQKKLVELIQGEHRIAMTPVASITSKISRFVSTIRRDIQAMCYLRRNPFAIKSDKAGASKVGAGIADNKDLPADIRFSNAIHNCDLEYLVENNRLKENIIVNSKCEAYEYLFSLNLKKLEARQNGNIIELFDFETSEVKYIIPAPYMYDMSGETSNNVQYLLEGSSGNYTLRVVADDEWINASERQFPVVIDPQIMANTNTIVSLYNGMRNSSNYWTPDDSIITIGNNIYNNQDNDFVAKIVLHGDAIRKQLGSDLRITHAILELTATGNVSAADTKGFEVSTSGTSATAIDRFIYNGVNNRIEIDITSQVQEIINKGINKNLFIKRINSNSVKDYIFIATPLNSETEHRPRIFVDYVSSRLNTTDMPYATVSAGNGGSGKVNLSTGNMIWEIPDVQIKSKGVNLSVSHIYDSCLLGDSKDHLNSASETMPTTPELCCGGGFKLNIQQFLLEKKLGNAITLLGTRNFVYIDGNGNHHDFVDKYFYTDENECKRYVNRLECSEDENGNLKYNGKDVEHKIENELGMELQTYKDLLEYALDGKEYSLLYYKMEGGRQIKVDASRAGESGVYAVRDYGDGIKISISDKVDMSEVEAAKTAMDECAVKLEEVKQQMLINGAENDIVLQSKKKRYEAELPEKTAKFNNAVSNMKRNPVDFVTTSDGQVLGFDYYGRLVMAGNGSESGSAYIIYNTDDRIEQIVDKDGLTLVKFGYKDGLLEYMIDKNGKTWQYQYVNGKMEKIIRGSDTVCQLSYLGGRLYDISKKVSGWNTLYGVRIEYDDSGKVKTLQEYSEIGKVTGNEEPTSCAKYCAKDLSIIYNDRYMTTLKDNKTGLVTTYIMDNIGRIVTAYEGGSNAAKSVTMEYRARKKAYSSSDLFNNNNIIGEVGPQNAVSSQLLFSVTDNEKLALIPKSGMLLLSAWGTAKSFHLINDRRITAYGDDMFGNYESDAHNKDDFQREGRRYGIFARIYYQNGMYTSELRTSFDYYNPCRQLAVLPLFIERRPNMVVSKIEFGVDYSNNNGTANFDGIKLTTCNSGTYREFDSDDLLKKETTDDGVTTFEYVDKKPVKTKFVRFLDNKELISLCEYDSMGRERFTRDYDGNCKETFYDDYGSVSKTEEYHESDSTTKYVKEYKYDNDGNVVYESDERGESGNNELWNINYIDNGLTTRTRNAAGAVTACGYNHFTGENTGLSGDVDGEPSTSQYTYTYGYMTKASHNGFDYDFEYDGIGRTTKVCIAGKEISSMEYSEPTVGTSTSTVNYSNGLSVKSTQDDRGRTKNVINTVNQTAQEILAYDYDGDTDRVKKLKDNVANITYEYRYDKEGKVVKANYSQNNRNVEIVNEYDEYGGLISATYTIDNESRCVDNIIYGEIKNSSVRVVKEQKLNEVNLYPKFDALGRYTGRHIENIGEVLLTEDQYYVKHGDRTSNLVASQRFGINGKLDEHLKYSYDQSGNISAIRANGEIQVRYSYDSLNRLVREENFALEEVIEIAYDIAGNIIKKTFYKIDGKTKIKEFRYQYTARGWRDCLRGIKIYKYDDDGKIVGDPDEQTIKYGNNASSNNLGRPTEYRGMAFAWSDYGDLSSITINETNESESYNYDANGIRISKTIDNNTTDFYRDGKTLLRTFDSERDIWYNYGVGGLLGITVRKKSDDSVSHYYFRRNALGDITHIYSFDGANHLKLEAEYKYDAWGNHKVCDGDGVERKLDDKKQNNKDFIGFINPIRYRGYYYDQKTGLYYLNARYYDPEIGRFISADDIAYLDYNSINGLNLFAYCGNNPVMDTDPDGTWSWGKFWNFVGAVFVAAIVVAAVVATAGGLAIAAGASVAVVNAVVAGAAIGGMVAGGMEIGSQLYHNGWGNIDIGSVAFESFYGATCGAIAGAAGATTSGTVRLALRGAMVGFETLASGARTAIHGGSPAAILESMREGFVGSFITQAFLTGKDIVGHSFTTVDRQLRYIEKGLFGSKDILRIGAVTAVKAVWREVKDPIQSFVMSVVAKAFKWIWRTFGW